ncbi:MAG: hypothetical protein ACHQF2_02585, partial [Flavobacteriales bacterium]
MRQPRLYLVFLTGSIFMVSCKKNDDTKSPSITITSPLQLSTHDVFDVITVKADLSDDKNIKSADVRILDPSGNNAVPAWHIEINSASYHLEHSFNLNDIHLPNGQYSIRVEAYDGTNRKTAFREINVNEIPRALKRIMVTRRNGSMVYLDSLGGSQINNFFSTPGDYSGAAVSSWWQQIYLQGSSASSLTAYQVNDMYPIWNYAAQPNGSLPFFNRLLVVPASTLVYSSDGYGYLKGYNKAGTMSENVLSPGGRLPWNTVECGPYIIIEHRDPISGNHLLNVHYKGSGSVLHGQPSSIQWEKLEVRGTDQIIAAGNIGTQGELRVYAVSTNVIFEPVNIPAGQVYDMVKIDDESYLISHASGILRYTYSNSSLVNITSGNMAQCMAYDQTLGLVVTGEGNMLNAYNPITGATSFSYPAADSIQD